VEDASTSSESQPPWSDRRTASRTPRSPPTLPPLGIAPSDSNTIPCSDPPPPWPLAAARPASSRREASNDVAGGWSHPETRPNASTLRLSPRVTLPAPCAPGATPLLAFDECSLPRTPCSVSLSPCPTVLTSETVGLWKRTRRSGARVSVSSSARGVGGGGCSASPPSPQRSLSMGDSAYVATFCRQARTDRRVRRDCPVFCFPCAASSSSSSPAAPPLPLSLACPLVLSLSAGSQRRMRILKVACMRAGARPRAHQCTRVHRQRGGKKRGQLGQAPARQSPPRSSPRDRCTLRTPGRKTAGAARQPPAGPPCRRPAGQSAA
jgi:hypothetical protein